MTFDEKEALARTRDGSKKAAGLRVAAARRSVKLGQKELAAKAGMNGSAAISNVEKGRAYPNWKLMTVFYREYKIDFNFMIYGDFTQLPQNVQEALFSELQGATDGLDQEAN